ncbi:SAM-dependent methyltransferase [Niabella sp. W65]|nr:SAM-dependent methyltransferase [Niabella sp. W65]MCH7362446.1 SAM-dependent methyltransferase [Niabella sp. W65]ULT38405.1 SAM-dependent methyltransferase [Niabella sp. I65]
MSKLILIGAGPGDPDLITVKAIKKLREADVILYDALANDELLSYSKPGCIQQFVGNDTVATRSANRRSTTLYWNMHKNLNAW